ENPKFNSFLEKYCKRKIPNESSLRKNYLNKCYDSQIQKIRDNIGISDIWISVDETTDVRGNAVANCIVGALRASEFCKPYLLTSKVLERTNSNTVARFVNDSLRVLWPTGSNEEKVKILYT
ncbi:unnamed protein product, partial [Tenebrio molitor]